VLSITIIDSYDKGKCNDGGKIRNVGHKISSLLKLR
jgi:hypothetical protein